MQAQERAQAVYPVDHNGLSPTTGAPPGVGDIVYIDSHLDPAAGMEVMYWRDIRAVFNDAVYVRHNSRTLDFLKGVDGNTLFPLRVAALHRAVMEIVIDAPLKPPADHVQRRIVPPPAPRPAPPTAMHRRPPPVTPHIVPRPPVLPPGQQTPRPTARNIMGRIVPHINLILLQGKGEGDKKDFPKVLKCYLNAVHKGHAHAQLAVGRLYFNAKQDSHGLRVVQDYTKAMEWFIKAADFGDADAQNEIGVLYTQGHGVPQDYKKAVEWLMKAADQGHVIAQANIGMVSMQGRIQALLTRTYELRELHEYPIPRLFIILPKVTSERNRVSHARNQFQLYFLCECGEHTQALNGDNTNIPHHIHIAKHEGYDLQGPTEFFQKYGRYMLTLLEMIKHGSTIEGYVVPALSSVDVFRAIGMLTNTQDTITVSAINQSIEYLQTLSSDQDSAKGTSTDSFAGQEALMGADLRHLKVFIKSKDQGRALGNLYRTITKEGHAKWVCIDHYRLAPKNQDQDAFVTVVGKNGGHYNPHLSRATASLKSKIQAAGFFEALAKAGRVDELIVAFNWESAASDLEAFGDSLEKAAVSILRLDLQRFRANLDSKLESANTQQALARCIDLPSMKMIHIILSVHLVELSSLQPKRLPFSPKLSFEVVSRQGVELGKRVIERLAETLKTNSSLTTLNLRENSIGENGAVALSKALKTNSTLTTLDLLGNSIGENGAVALSEALKINPTLTTLNLDANSIKEKGAVALSGALMTNSTLATLYLSSNSIRDIGTVALSRVLKTNSTLTTLELSGNSIGDKGVVALYKALKTNSTLSTLHLSCNSIKEKGAVALSIALKTNSSLTTLDLSLNSIGENGAGALSEALKTNSTLTTLDLYDNSIGEYGAVALSEALKINSTLTTLNLGHNSIRKNEAVALSEALKANSTLTTLDLDENLIGDDGAVALSEALKTNSSLTTLELCSNSIREKGTVALSGALKTNSTLTTLKLSSNSIGDDGAVALSEALKTNSTLTTLELYRNSIGENGDVALFEALKVNLIVRVVPDVRVVPTVSVVPTVRGVPTIRAKFIVVR